ncbi:response regulator [Anaerobacillus sp. CMMVII]|uniref:response regulator transcription factor n=1 Tax=Anaerobacillus sp. CMMVII TaxID=2755588 RepID=UPI0021B84D6E|nr:response regulator [Anaerobacillus sp. CMMVII]MCT8137056.1 response regulator [Anaerobacillus sp. CMMVII]
MWKVLLVEDEILVRETVKEMINWEQFGFQVIGEAGNGEDALHFIREEQPDLVITDILMPIMNGVELLKQTRAEGFQTNFVMLSCMSDFEYVQQALEYGASNYLLKHTMDIDAIENMLKKIRPEIIKRINGNSKEIEEYYQKIWKQVLTSPPQEHMELGKPPFIPETYTLTIVMTYKKLLEKDIFPKDEEAIIHFFQNNGQSTVFYWSEKIPLIKSNGITQKIVYSSLSNLSNISVEWKSLLQKLDLAWYGLDEPTTNSKQQQSSERGEELWEIENEIIQAFMQMKQKTCIKLIDDLWFQLQQNVVSLTVVKEIALGLNNIFCRVSNTPDQETELIITSTSHDQLKEKLLEFTNRYLEYRKNQKCAYTDHSEINKVIEYIQMNYDEQITVKMMSLYIAMNENYLSSLFKKKTGYSLIEYLHKIRITHAKDYLEKTNLPISVISHNVGYENDNYFIKMFKRLMNITPNEYRCQKKN